MMTWRQLIAVLADSEFDLDQPAAVFNDAIGELSGVCEVWSAADLDDPRYPDQACLQLSNDPFPEQG